jgi:N6-L-threonylcarbamoyladenine synthase
MLILGIESTCDETGAAIVRDGTQVLSNVIASSAELHARYRGVVPEIACRAHIENILPVIRQATEKAGVKLEELDSIAVAYRPGLIGSLLIGVTAAKTLAWALSKPFIGVDHVQAHLYSVILKRVQSDDCRLQNENQNTAFAPSLGTPACSERSRIGEDRGGVQSAISFPAIGLVCSGGHTALYLMNSFTEVRRIGGTIDDAVGEAYDKVASILGLGYPGGPIIDSLAREGNPEAVSFPRTLLEKESLDFSFSGLKTAVLYHVHGIPKRGETKEQRHAHGLQSVGSLTQQNLRDIAASFQAACVDILMEKIRRAVHQYHAKCVVIGGGVSANSGLRHAAMQFKLPVYFPAIEYCTDNAAMSAGLAQLYWDRGEISSLNLDAVAS